MYRHAKENAKFAGNNRLTALFDAMPCRLTCASCGRSLSKVAYRDHRGLPIGPMCAKRIGAYDVVYGGISVEPLKAAKQSKKTIKKVSAYCFKNKRYDENQRDFFDGAAA